jgi:hypothetical protein
MVGVGSVFADFHSGRLEADDEVAVDHGPAELGYPPVNEAMVDIRATLEEALRRGVVAEPSAKLLLALAKKRFYAERTYPELLAEAAVHGAAPADLRRFAVWLPAGRVSRKNDDALALLAALREFLASDGPPLAPAFRFERTETWDADVAFALPLEKSGGELRRELLFDELRLDPKVSTGLRNEAMGIALARREAERSRIALQPEEIESFRRRWLARQDLIQQADLAAWRRANHLDGEAFEDFVLARAREARLAAMAQYLVDDSLADALRIRGGYAMVAARALEKQRAVSAAGDVSLAESGISAFDLISWFCGERLHRAIPADIEQFAVELSFPSAEALYRALLREHLYIRLTGEKDERVTE